MRALIYTRASLDRTGEGKSNERQDEECQRLITFKRWELVRTEADISISAYGLKERPAWLRVLGAIEAGEVDVVVAWHLDRLTRNMADLEQLIILCEKHNVSIATATGDIDLTNDTGRMVARILAAVARQEVERKAARQRLAHAQRRQEGRPWAGVKMLGYTRDGQVVEEEAQAIREAAEDFIEGRASLKEIGERWSALDSPYKVEGKSWTGPGVRNVLTNPRLAGYLTATTVVDGRKVRDIVGQGAWEPILDEHTWTLAVAKVQDPSRRKGTDKRYGQTPRNLLTRIMVCERCEQPVRAGSKRGVASYMCPEYHAQVNRHEADELVRSSFAAAVALSGPGAVLPASRVVVGHEDVLAEMERLRERLALLARSYAQGVTEAAVFEEVSTEIHSQVQALEASLSGAAEEFEWERLRAESVRNFLTQGLVEQRQVLSKSAVVTLAPGVRGKAGARRQVTVQVKAKRGETDVLIPAYVPNT